MALYEPIKTDYEIAPFVLHYDDWFKWRIESYISVYELEYVFKRKPSKKKDYNFTPRVFKKINKLIADFTCSEHGKGNLAYYCGIEDDYRLDITYITEHALHIELVLKTTLSRSSFFPQFAPGNQIIIFRQEYFHYVQIPLTKQAIAKLIELNRRKKLNKGDENDKKGS